MRDSEQLTEILDMKLRPPVRWLISMIVCVVIGNASVITLAYDVRQIALHAHREAEAAKAREADLRVLIGHARDIAVLKEEVNELMNRTCYIAINGIRTTPGDVKGWDGPSFDMDQHAVAGGDDPRECHGNDCHGPCRTITL